MAKSATEPVVLVDDHNNPIGTAEKSKIHHANTPLHRAFSCYAFNDKGELLVTQRALSKKVWPGVWTNSICGHPKPDESTEAAIARRLTEELGMSVKDLTSILPDYRYKTPPFKGVIENEICPVYFARAASMPRTNPEEVEALRWTPWDEYIKALKADPGDVYSYWAKDQMKQLQTNAAAQDFFNA